VDVRRLRPGEWIAGIAGAGLLAAMFVDWYEVDATGAGASAWEAFSAVDLALAVLGLLAVALAATTAAQRSAAMPVALASTTVLIGLVALPLLAWRVASPPDAEVTLRVYGSVERTGTLEQDMKRDAGLWLGLGASMLVMAGALAAMRDERIPHAARVAAPVELIEPPPEGEAA
jgi:hypothetical protein